MLTKLMIQIPSMAGVKQTARLLKQRLEDVFLSADQLGFNRTFKNKCQYKNVFNKVPGFLPGTIFLIISLNYKKIAAANFKYKGDLRLMIKTNQAS